MSKVSIVVPVFQSGSHLNELYNRLNMVLDKLMMEWEIILIDDASNDGTFNQMLELRKIDRRIKIIRFAKNMGQHQATLCGLQRASGDYVITLDDDLQNPPEEIPKFIEKIKEGYDLVIGQIIGPKNHSFFRNKASIIMQRLVSAILSKPREITLSSYRAMTARAKDKIANFSGAHAYLPALMFSTIPPERICNIPIRHDSRINGESKYTLRKLFKLCSYLLINHSKTPLRIMAAWGIFISILSLAYAIFIVIRVLAYGSHASGWPSLAVLISFLSGNILFCVGVLGEYIGRLLEEKKHGEQFPIFEEYLE